MTVSERLQAGFARVDISVYEPGMLMLGWGMLYNKARGVAMPLHARAAVVTDDDGGAFAFVVCDLLCVSQGLWLAVVDRLATEHPALGLGAHNVAISATHTHSGPSGYSHHFLINMNAPGFSRTVYEALVERIVGAIVDAHAARVPARVSVAAERVPTGEGIAFNRSWFAYNRNVDVEPVTYARRDEATERLTTVLRFDDADGNTLGLVNWLALHGTTVHADNTLLHPDHKGIAAAALEADGGVAVLAQECCGDVSPNYRWDARRGHTMGRYDDDLASAQHVGEVQAKHARKALAAAGEAHDPARSQVLRVRARYVDFTRAPAAPRFTPDGTARTTTPARMGMSMARGTAEGPGPLGPMPWLTNALSGGRAGADVLRGLLRRRRTHDPKVPFLDLHAGVDGKLAGLIPLRSGRVPPVDPVFAWVGQQLRAGNIAAGTWVPQRLAMHLACIGPIAILAVPFELTTVAGRRVRRLLRAALPDDVEHIVITPYSNAYAGYLTTFEEYQVQHYEAGYTLFGPFTLAALMTAVSELADDLTSGPATGAMQGPAPERTPLSALEPLAFGDEWPYVAPPSPGG